MSVAYQALDRCEPSNCGTPAVGYPRRSLSLIRNAQRLLQLKLTEYREFALT
jgi:hypothetical protein